MPLRERDILDNEQYLEQVVLDYHQKAAYLMRQLEAHLGIPILDGFTWELLLHYVKKGRRHGQFGDWRYNIHGFHCGFENQRTREYIEACTVCGDEYGALDPYFIGLHLQWLCGPLKIEEPYWDGKAIIDVLLKSGKLEYITGEFPEISYPVVTSRRKSTARHVAPPEQRVTGLRRFLSFFSGKRVR